MPVGGEIVPDDSGATRGKLYFMPLSNTYTRNTVKGETKGYNLVVGSESGKGNISTYLGIITPPGSYRIALDIDSLLDHLKHLYLEFRFNGSVFHTGGYDAPLSKTKHEQLVQSIEDYRDNVPAPTPKINGNPIIDMKFRYLTGDGSPKTYRPTGGGIEPWTLIQEVTIPDYSQPYIEHIINDDFLLKFDFDFKVGEPQPIPVAAVTVEPPRNWLLMGAPGTGKSRQLSMKAKNLVESTGGTDDDHVFRISFNPATTYGKFIGELRPSMIYQEPHVPTITPTYCYLSGDSVDDPTIPGLPMITYKFIPGVFLKAYAEAKKNSEQAIVLLIDEVNRADIYEVFGEVFQLMERKNDGTGVYTENSLMKEAFDYLGEDSVTLPPNFYIWATMNPNDASVQIIDSAFMRRWTTDYYGINRGDHNDLDIPVLRCEWEVIRNCINTILIREGFDEGELLGKWFIKSTDCKTWERFYSKVVFHLANFVVKEDLEILFSKRTVREVMADCERNFNPFNDEVRDCARLPTIDQEIDAERERLITEQALAQEANEEEANEEEANEEEANEEEADEEEANEEEANEEEALAQEAHSTEVIDGELGENGEQVS